ncbi:hypothetical protein PAU_01437 [Photorhabdus asymbiotica]|uniref:Uncharacterized protein n=1 Tax=Photorhabdus asymbiotica subsp. asymbiotica (strain ATCC 43949 / 3105-77) TaxID=553480 RepID=C7BT69_PHOAA|nr:hypothetical protein PAU_01437 [Photorhabdus asymbiotica]
MFICYLRNFYSGTLAYTCTPNKSDQDKIAKKSSSIQKFQCIFWSKPPLTCIEHIQTAIDKNKFQVEIILVNNKCW